MGGNGWRRPSPPRARRSRRSRALELKGGAVSAHRLLKHPVVVRIVQLIRDEQLARVLRGEFGVQSQARAAAPAITQNLTELAGAAAANPNRPHGHGPAQSSAGLKPGASVGSTIPPPTSQHYPVNPHAAASTLLTIPSANSLCTTTCAELP